ncbi:MAG: hypothetical protein WDN28_16160 [Chthoniobacter sp.]
MKTARFSQVVAKCGQPEVHVAWIAPARDRVLQAAVKTNRVMTVLQENVGTKADHGIVGFEAGQNRQFLIFPKSLRSFAGRGIVGIQYDLLDSREVSQKDQAPPARLSKSQRPRRASAKKEKPPTSPKVVPFPRGVKEKDSEEVAELKARIRHAMALLEDGKTVAAFNLLQRTVDD